MTADVASRPAAQPPRGLARIVKDRTAWITAADIVAILIAVALPVSTSAVEILAGVFVAVLLPTLDVRAFVALLKRPVCALPLALVLLALIGTLWSDAPWVGRIVTLRSLWKLLMLPFLLYHFMRSERGPALFVAFLGSCAFVMAWSFAVAIEPQLAIKRAMTTYGVPLKDYIDQSQEFALCIFGAVGAALMLLRAGKKRTAIALIAISVCLVANLAFVTLARTAFVYMPVMLLVFALFFFSRKVAAALVLVGVLAAGGLWAVSPNLRAKVSSISTEYDSYRDADNVNSVGLRLEFWRKSLTFIADAPLFGHGTGSIKGLFERAAVNQTAIRAEVIANPHNQTLNVAIQWGLLGVVVLYALWIVHLLTFRGTDLPAWIGLMVVVQNMMSSIFNSHLFDFHEGWMYVLGVSVAAGMVLGTRAKAGTPRETA